MNNFGASVTFHTVGVFVWRLVWGLVKVAARFCVGLPLDGHRRTDATFVNDGVRDLREPSFWSRRKVSRWARMAGYKRALVRWLVVAALIVAALSPTIRVVGGVLVAGSWLGWKVVKTIRDFQMRKHMQDYLLPLHTTLAPRLGIAEDTRPQDWLEVPTDFHLNESVIRIDLPEGFVWRESGSTLVTPVVLEKLELSKGDIDVSTHMLGSSPYVEYKRVPPPPEKVLFKDVRELLEKQPESAPLIGLGRRETPVSVDFDAEAPHALSSMAPGAGKSMLAKGVMAQTLHHGGQVVVLDLKRHSHKWARGLDGVLYLRDIEDIHNALIWIAAEMARRNVYADDLDEDPDFTRYLVVAEEMNATILQLRNYWKKIRPKENKNDPSPAVDALGELLFMGRAVKGNVWAIAQLGTARTMGGPEMREAFSNRILGRYSVNAWRMLVPEVWPMPKASKRPGRVQVVVAGQAMETQAILWTDDEAREWASSGVPSQSPKLALTLPTWENEVGTVPTAAGLTEAPPPVVIDPVVPAEPELLTLKEACDRGLITGYASPEKALDGVRSASKRDPEFPTPAGQRGRAHLYRPEDLERWLRNRPKLRAVDDSEPDNEESTDHENQNSGEREIDDA